MKKLLFIFSVAAFLMACRSANAQNFVWAKHFGGASNDYAVSIVVDDSGNVYTTGNFVGTADFDPGPGIFNLTASTAGIEDVFITKFDAFGNFVWAKKFGGTDIDIGNSVAVDASGSVYTTGYVGSSSSNIFVLKFDAAGNLLWSKFLGGTSTDYGYAITTDAFAMVYVTGYLTRSGYNYGDIFITKLDSSGNSIWTNTFGGLSPDYGRDIAVDASGNVYATGNFVGTADFDPGPATFNLYSSGMGDAFIVKVDSSGNLIWAKQFGGTDSDVGYSISLDASGNVYTSGYFSGTVDFDPSTGTHNLTSSGNSDAFIVKVDSSGSLIWVKQFVGIGDVFIAVDALETLYFTGSFHDTADFDPGPGVYNLTSSGGTDIFISQFDAFGGLIWAKQFGSTLNDFGQSIAIDASGYVSATGYFSGTVDFVPGSGTFSVTSAGNADAFVLKLTQIPPYVVQGNVFGDVNTNCNIDTSDISLPDWLIKVEPGPFYGMSDLTGNYAINLFDTGRYTISVATQDTLWQPLCNTLYNLQVTTIPDSASGINFAMKAAFYCPRLIVELGTPRLRRCGNNTYTIRYANTGTLQVSNAYIEVDFGEYLQPQSSTLPWSTVSGNVYTFPIGNLNINQQGSFNVTAYLDCAADLGSTQCVTAHIYPDSLCLPTPAGWDKSETVVNGTCVNDSLVCFAIKNRSAVGSGDMGGAAQWRLYVNDTLVTQGTYQLAGGDSIVKCFPANGKTYRLEADQNPPHPRRSKPQAIVEVCGSPTAFGFVNTVAQDDEELAVETFCMQVIGSFDPNDKQVSPIGITSNNYITADDELEYLIRFQNTGTDTAFKVVIRDTIATDVLDIATLTSGASSHDYTFNIYGQGIAEWTFDNILLPDSFVNEEASHGFVQFKIRQLPGNPDGTLIENRAAIYFDFNAPVITNTAWNEVNEAEMPVSLFSASTNSTCPDTSGGAINVAVSGGLKPYTYQWSSGQTNSAISNLSQGVYSVTVTDEAESVFMDTVNIPNPLATSISTQSSVSCIGGNDAAAKANPAGGISPYTAEWSDGQIGFTANNLSAGNYQVTVADSNGCELVTSITIQDGYQVNTGNIAGADSADINQTSTYSVNAGLNYTWSATNGVIVSGQGTNSIEVDWNAIGQGTVEVAVTDSGCTETVSKTITLIDPTGIEKDLLNAIELYPNPTNGTITLKQMASLGGMPSVTIKLYDSIGKQVLIQTATPSELQQGILLDLKGVNEGVYFLSIKTEVGMRMIKVVKY